jgi:3-hydroxyacyl-[acyl-carrier-protein] dehydratase
MLNINDINKKIKQRPPFQMIERVLELEPGKMARGTKCVSVNEPYFMGHFPGAPIMPGVLIIESCAQLCSFVFDTDASDEEKLYVIVKVDNFKFAKPVIPGDRLDIYVDLEKTVGPLAVFNAKVMVDGVVHAKGTMTFTSVDKDQIYK